MLLAGDEIGHTQNGNNNTYCQDSELTWLNWDLSREDQRFVDFTSCLIEIRKQHRLFRRRHFFQGRSIRGLKDIIWLTPDGHEMTDEEWNQSFARCLGVFLAGEGIEEYDERGRIITDGDGIILFNSHHESIPFKIPEVGEPDGWRMLLDTSVDQINGGEGRHWRAGEVFDLKARSLALLYRDRKRAPLYSEGPAADCKAPAAAPDLNHEQPAGK
jgi:glycogen operon protein